MQLLISVLINKWFTPLKFFFENNDITIALSLKGHLHIACSKYLEFLLHKRLIMCQNKNGCLLILIMHYSINQPVSALSKH